MLCLQNATNPEWIPVAINNPLEILIDHAHCEKKAAAFAMGMISRYPEHTKLVMEMIDIAREELDHFEIVVQELEKRGATLRFDPGNDYAQQLRAHVRSSEETLLLDLLIVGAFIEARSCERFSLLAEHAPTEDMRELYRSLLASEAGHYRVYTDIAREYYSKDEVKTRLEEFGTLEAEIVKGLPNKPTMHG